MPDFVIYPHAALSKKAEKRKPDASMLAAGSRLLAAAQAVEAYGLAAAHLGLDEPVVVISITDGRTRRDYRILYNPELLSLSAETEIGMEGSVSLPGIEVPVSRAIRAEIGYQDAEGQPQAMQLEGFVARVAQHEIDQVDGLFFLRRVSSVKRDTALRKFQKMKRQ